jgi:hypothetical protein
VIWVQEDRAALNGLSGKYKELHNLSEIPATGKDKRQGETVALAHCRKMLGEFRNTRQQWSTAK